MRDYVASAARRSPEGGKPFTEGFVPQSHAPAAEAGVDFADLWVQLPRWVAFRSHYGFDAFYCRPGPDGAHEKGGVKGEVGRFRRTRVRCPARPRWPRPAPPGCSPPATTRSEPPSGPDTATATAPER